MSVPTTHRRAPAVRWTPLALALTVGCSGGGDGPTDSTQNPPPAVVASVDVTAPATALMVGSTLTLTATPRAATGAAVATAPVAWSSSDAAVATVSNGGVVTGVGLGTVTIRASSNGREASVGLKVRTGGTITTAGGTVGASTGGVTLTVPAGALATATTLTVEPTADPTGNEHLVPGTAHEFGPDGTQFAQPVTLSLKYDPAALPAGTSAASLRIAKRVGASWQVIGEGASVDQASGRVTASIRSFSSYAVVADPCVVGSLSLGGTSGRISAHDCLYAVADRRSDYYTFTPAAGQMVTVASSGALQGIVGLKEATADPSAGTVWTSGSVGGTLRLVSNGSPLQLFVSGQDGATFGDYALVRGSEAPSHSCATDTYLVPGVSVAQPLNQANSCVVAIEYPAIPQAKGKPLHAHYYGVKLEAGKTYTISITGLGGGFDPGLAVFAGGPVASSLPNGQAVTSRTVTVTPSTTRVHVIEIGSGHFTDGTYTTWVNPSGSYTLSVSQ